MKKTAQALSVAIIGAMALAGADAFGADVEPAAAKVRADCYVQAPLPPVHRSYIRRDVVEPGVYEVGRSPAVYGWTRTCCAERRVLLRPYKNYAHFQRPYIAYYRERVTVQPEGWRWVPARRPAGC